MYVCLCKGVTEKEIRREVESGADTFDDVQLRLDVALCCGQCRESAEEIIREALTGGSETSVDNVINMWQPHPETHAKPHIKAYG